MPRNRARYLSARGEISALPVGNAVVVHQTGEMTGSAQAMAMRLARDPEHDLVVVDLPADLSISAWEAVAALLPRRRRGLRLVVGGRSRDTIALAGHLLAERLGRTVITPDGAIIEGAGGALFVHSGQGTGWIRIRAGKPSQLDGKRFPRVSWECDAFADVVDTSSTAQVEPLPGGLWLRPIRVDDSQDRHRATLITTMPTQPDVLTVVLGCPLSPAVSVDDVARMWMRLPEDIRPKVRFSPYGPVSLLAGRDFGSTLAWLIDAPIRCYTGLPVGDSSGPEVVTVTPDGAAGWYTFARELRYRPPGNGESPLPEVVDHRPPLPGMQACGPASYWYAPDAVVEVVPSGLLIRGTEETATADRLRAMAPDSTVNRVVVDAHDNAGTARMKHLARDLLNRLDEVTRRASRVVSVNELWQMPSRPAIAPARSDTRARIDVDEPPALLAAQVTEVVHLPYDPPQPGERFGGEPPAAPSIAVSTPTTRLMPSPAPVSESVSAGRREDDGTRVQETPLPEASALAPDSGIDKERQWLRATLAASFDAMSDAVIEALTRHPDLADPSPDMVTDGVMVRLYLSSRGAAVDEALRSAAPGPHVPVARSVLAGLARLQKYQGAAGYTTTMTAAQAEYYRQHRVVTDWSFRNALARPADLPGDTDILLWSVSSRRTAILEPDDDGVAERVVFLPGTRFSLLDVAEPTVTSRGVLMLREMSTDEIGEPDPGLDMAALDLLWDSGEWTGAETHVPDAAVDHFTTLPGLA